MKTFAKKLSQLLPDKLYLTLRYRARLGSWPNLKDPQTYNEKIQWLKLHDRKPEYTKMVDKYEAKKYIAEKVGEQYVIPTYGIWDNFDDIDFDSLPNRFVLKCTHNSGDVIVCLDKDKLDFLRKVASYRDSVYKAAALACSNKPKYNGKNMEITIRLAILLRNQ